MMLVGLRHVPPHDSCRTPHRCESYIIILPPDGPLRRARALYTAALGALAYLNRPCHLNLTYDNCISAFLSYAHAMTYV